MTPSKFFVAMAFLTALGRADVLIGREPCLWKRPVTVTRGDFYSYNCETTETEVVCKPNHQVDTTGWETYWDVCPALHGGTAVDLGGK